MVQNNRGHSSVHVVMKRKPRFYRTH